MAERTTLLLLPGLLCDRASWQPTADLISDVADIIVPQWGQRDSLVTMAEYVLAIAPQRFALAGHSMGGRVALEIMRKAPERIECLTLLDTGYAPRLANEVGDRERANRLRLVQIARERGMRAMGIEWARPMVHPRCVDTPLFEEILQMIERSTPDIFEAQQQALIARPDATDVLTTIRCPTRVVVGREDAWSTLPQHEYMHAAIAGSRLHVIEDCGHMTPMEQSQSLASVLREWLLNGV